MKASVSLAEARRIALSAQLSPGAQRPATMPGPAAIAKLVERLNLLQIDSVNVLSRSHYLPVFSRLGPYDRSTLDELTFARNRKRRFFEYWAHEASFLPMRLYPLLRWRMDAARRGEGIYKGLTQFAAANRAYVKDVLAEVRDRGPLTVRGLTRPGRRSAHWWGWSTGKTALEYLFWTGEVTVATRRNFERHYDLPDRVVPKEFHDAAPPPRPAAIRELMRLSATALGIASFAELRDYFRLPLADARKALGELIESGELMTVRVDGWRENAFVPRDLSLPRRTVPCSALVSPFDPLVWQRSRAERLFGFSYRIEIYTPAAQRKFGYYVLPFLHGDRFVARLCLKSDRTRNVLKVNAAHLEDGAEPAETAEALAPELKLLAGFLDLHKVEVARRGNLAAEIDRRLQAFTRR
jgi:uncharacterized protein YcaQ